MQTFADRFAAQNGEPIEHQGRLLHAIYWLPVKNGDMISVRFLHFVHRPIQGVGVRTENCEVKVGEVHGKHLALWTDTAPDRITLHVTMARQHARIGFFNQWRDEKYGTTMYRLNNAAMEVVKQPDGSLMFRCSDGWGEADFNDLVVEVKPLAK